MNANLKINGEKIQMPTTAKLVSYGDSNVEDALNDLSGFEMSAFGRQLYEADEREFYRLLKISKETFWDEGQTRFKATGGAILLASQAKVGEKSLSLTADRCLRSAAPVEFGGAPFTITFYMNATKTASTNYFRALGTNRSFGMWTNADKYWSLYYGTTSIPTWCGNSTPTWASGWQLVKFSYNGSTLSLSAHGMTFSATISVPREPRRLFFGPCAGLFDEFKLIDDGVTKVHLTFE